MSIEPNSSRRIYIGLAGALLISVLFFQNCSQSSLSGDSSSSSPNSSSSDNSSSSVDSNTHEVGKLYGSCTMQGDHSMQVVQNGLIDNKGNRVATYAMGGNQSWPITNCPNSGNMNAVECASGFKPVMRNLVQMNCGTTTADFCKTYWITFNCVKL